jgi:hypothetical protein
MANDTKTIEILPEDEVKLTNDQQNLIELALAKQVPLEDAEFMEKIQKGSKDVTDAYSEISRHFAIKYGKVFGAIYLAAITDGEQGYKEAVRSREESKAKERMKMQSLN